jgi:hypothetical protein
MPGCLSSEDEEEAFWVGLELCRKLMPIIQAIFRSPMSFFETTPVSLKYHCCEVQPG